MPTRLATRTRRLTMRLSRSPSTRTSPTKSDVDFGYVPNNTITGTVYRDDNRDKMIDGDEPGLERVSVQLLDEDGNVVQTLDTAADGTYAFQHLKDGKYTVKVVRSSAIKDYDQTEDPDATIDDTSAVYTMGPGHSLQENVNFGYVPDYFIKGTIYRDGNRSGALDTDEKLYEGVTVQLRDADGTVVATTTTDADGAYSFDKLPAGTYTVTVVQDGPIAGLEQTGDPDATKDNASESITLNNDNPSTTDVNFGYVNNNSLSGTVYRDDSRNGDQDGTEPGYSGVIVQLLDKDGQVITTTTTDANGRYSFDKLPDGTYSVTVVKDGELADTEQTEDPDATKDNSSEPVTLGEDNPSKDHIDFGYVPDYSIHGLVYRDGDRSESHGTDEKATPTRPSNCATRTVRSSPRPRRTRTAPTPSRSCPPATTPSRSSRTVPSPTSTRRRTRTPPRTAPPASSR